MNLKDENKDIINKIEKENINGLISIRLLDTFEGLSKQDSNNYYYSPKKFLNNLIVRDDSFKGSRGNDSGDLLSTILTACQEEWGQDSDPQDMSLDPFNLNSDEINHKKKFIFLIFKTIMIFFDLKGRFTFNL